MTAYPHIPHDFLWGASSSAHQTEGDNTNSNWWHFETAPGSPFPERSGRAVDSYHRYREDMTLLADAGLTSYRFSVEWARIEPSPGVFSEDALRHYRAMIETAFEVGLAPVVTLHHFTTPLWFHDAGGWRNPAAGDHFAAYVEHVSPIVADVPYICTINEPNMIALLAAADFGKGGGAAPAATADAPGDDRAIASMALPAPADDVSEILSAAHRRAVAILRPVVSGQIGWTVSNQAFEAEPGNELALEEMKWSWEDRFLEVSRDDDFVGVQSYTTRSVGAEGILPYEDDGALTLTGWPNRPDALGVALRNAWEITRGVPLLVTENGIATDDDSIRTTYIDRALTEVDRALAAGIDVRGYLHWSALDNYEWGEWRATFGLIEVDRSNFTRLPRPSLFALGAHANGHRRADARSSATPGRSDSNATLPREPALLEREER